MCASILELLRAAREVERLAENEKSRVRRLALTRRAQELKSEASAKLRCCMERQCGSVSEASR